ncbi:MULTISPECIES: NAD(P)-dependent glycerol-1-phosphate dehydrogenase [Methanoculleus]|uniref:Glycerol-1-phosphate dehydrogenase [NAD(P)+] n=2 Tax=Methanoculleus TaxID=45989 RepID=G1PDH_METMJ|nr:MULTISPECIES: NAD(P)-dependent glycerol-1-phosphate dehydrogenase [Methanoculleus]A3CX71.1 RecName: Full=Glycerol-1-phosphate dehydrogenase [NAD(P)+]; Short=G1P dehydrogenase; Short=G1PDH; AltName: Full=Enantiomeric glycerophosphate synthase; AltName: Full=sn-glycerol-1-phosphate dehydrogenase [Methanoculleus marisnigri JR1]ABN57971.1 3-dehydroquinate synthase [Methanoculleus marisnigri JR1]UYU19354.1 NAD(P)-dependent glycerol-1-phosphate dehydrogenase [Methanoculleus submarinus]
MSADRINLLRTKVFDKSKWMQLPRDVVIGHDVIEQIPAVCEDLALGDSVLIVSGGQTRDIAGKRVEALLAGSYDVVTFAANDGNPFETIRKAEEAAATAGFVIGVGGGRVIDTAKIASYNTDRHFISVPTAASHDGIASSRASVPTADGNVSLAAEPPIAVVADTAVIASAPHRLLASGCADIIANYTAILDWELSHRLRGEPLSEYALTLSRMTAEILFKNADLIKPHSEESAWLVTKALVSSGVAMSIAGSSRPGSGGEHKFSHALEKLAPGKGLHGEKCGIGAIITMYLHGGDWEGIRDSLKKIGAPTTPAAIGVDDETAVAALLAARTIRPERFTILDMGLTEESARDLVKMLYRE